jgi:predicted phosphodiesterase
VNIAVISDLHLGSDDPTDSFGHDDADFLRFLFFLERNFERIVLLGDIWETLTSPRPWSARDALRTARERHPDIARRFTGQQYKYVHGNHDLVAAEVDQAPEAWQLEANGRRLLFTHGHGHDRLIRHAQCLVELGVCLGGWIRRAGWHGLYRWLDHLERSRSDVARDPAACSFQAWAMAVADRRDADIVVTGHTHLALASQHGNRLYLNSGSCSQGRYTYLSIDPKKDVYGVHNTW